MSMSYISRAISRIKISSVNAKILKSSETSFPRYYSSTNEPAEKPKRKTTPIPSISLIRDDEILVTTLEEAQKLSKRRDLRLVKMVDLDTKTQRPIYKLMSVSEYKSQESEGSKSNKQNSNKGEKFVMIGQNISEHDLNTRMKKMNKWLEKSYEVRIVINGDSTNMDKAESVYKLMENGVGTNGRIVQKRQKGSDIKFQILPPKNKKDDDNAL
ncbi:hypothetical protein JTB14_013002 [Gonioctena quinquepunctata]|nr:hypothetical protein JTB14_013002 [Gonioctena quinquepunctata]